MVPLAARRRCSLWPRHQPANSPRLWLSGLTLSPRGPDLPDGLFARGLCGAVTRGCHRYGGPVARRSCNGAQRSRDLSPLSVHTRQRCGPCLCFGPLPRPGADRDDRRVGYRQIAGPQHACALAAERAASRLSQPPAWSVGQTRVSRAGPERDSRGLCPGDVGQPKGLGGASGTDVVSWHSWGCGRPFDGAERIASAGQCAAELDAGTGGRLWLAAARWVGNTLSRRRQRPVGGHVFWLWQMVHH
mmetsp:Transcript_100/g.287  ORF Transcript_100/g.287 Transcript_100/m.287 type:complete len:245 (-) Transcript_100:1678-2412(-)